MAAFLCACVAGVTGEGVGELVGTKHERTTERKKGRLTPCASRSVGLGGRLGGRLGGHLRKLLASSQLEGREIFDVRDSKKKKG